MANRVVRGVGNLNDFSDDVLCHIISFLPTREAVRTSLLSTRWRYLFTFLSNLDFEMPDCDDEDGRERFMDFVDKLVFYRDIPSIVRFRLQSDDYIDSRRLGLVVCALVWHKIQELDLCIQVCEYQDMPLPPNLFSCESLVVLKLDICWDTSEYKFPERICLPHLKVLHLQSNTFRNDGSEERLISNCPVLEDLVLGGCFIRRGNKFNVTNQNLKTLTLKLHLEDPYSEDDDVEERESAVPILINAPSLVLLNYSISDDHFIVLEDATSLAKAIIGFHGRYSTGTAVLGVLRQIQDVQTLEIEYQVLRVLKSSGLQIPLFDKTTCLKISGFRFNLICWECFLTRCVVLETLVLEPEDYSPQSTIRVTSNQYTLQKSKLAPLLRRLKTIEIQLHDIAQAETLMTIIEFFLKNARVLEELIVHSDHSPYKQQVEIMRKITSFPRVSKKCRVLL